MDLEEIGFDCPHCGQAISILVDPSVDRQDYVEDCEVCCRPIRLVIAVDDGQLRLEAEAGQ
jgi:hypothetical protein